MLRFCQVLRLVLDPDMLLQLAKKSAVTTPTGAGAGGAGGRGGRGRGRGQQRQQQKPRSPYSHVDAWKSINDRPFARWIDPSVDVWDARFEEGGPPNAEWLELPPLAAELDRAAGVIEVRLRAAFDRKERPTTFLIPPRRLLPIFLYAVVLCQPYTPLVARCPLYACFGT